MATFLYRIKQENWVFDDCPWCGEGEFPADPLTDLPTKSNKLSVWIVEQDQQNLNYIISALASQRPSAQHYDYVLIEEGVFSDLGIKIDTSIGSTPDDEANHLWHRDLIELSAQKLVALAGQILQQNNYQRILFKDVSEHIQEAVASRRLNLKRVNPDLKKSLGIT